MLIYVWTALPALDSKLRAERKLIASKAKESILKEKISATRPEKPHPAMVIDLKKHRVSDKKHRQPAWDASSSMEAGQTQRPTTNPFEDPRFVYIPLDD